MSERELRDIAEYAGLPPTLDELRYLQRKISAAGEMKTAIKRLLDSELGRMHTRDYDRKLYALREAMEDYLNADSRTSA